MIRCVALLIALAGLLGPTTVVAEASDDLRDMLKHVPQGALADGGVASYVDYRAVESARPGAARPGSTGEWATLREMGEAPFGLWLAAIRGVVSGSGRFLEAFGAAGEDQPGIMGFDFFDVDRELHFGNPPGDGLVLAGTFDPQAIMAAHEARAFTATEDTGWVLLCGAAGCDQGTAVDLQALERADPFGGHLGRQQPLLASNEILLSSAVLGTTQAMRAASESSAASLVDHSGVRVVLDAIPDDVLLRQAMLVPSELLLADMGVVRDVEEVQKALDSLALDPIPPYRLVLVADTATPDEQAVHIILAYTSEEAAKVAAEALPRRLEAGRSIRADRTMPELLDDQGVNDISSSVHVSPDGSGAAAMLTLRAPLASPDLSATPIVASSLPYRLVLDMVVSRDMGWLAASSPSDLSGD